jgi:hypothetical protein
VEGGGRRCGQGEDDGGPVRVITIAAPTNQRLRVPISAIWGECQQRQERRAKSEGTKDVWEQVSSR